MNKILYLGLSILDLSKTVMYGFWYDYLKPKYGENEKRCYVHTNSFIAHVKTDDIYKDIPKDVEKKLTFQILKETHRCLKEKIRK